VRSIKARDSKPYDLPKQKGRGAWFYTNRGSIDLVVDDAQGKIVQYRFRVRDMAKIVKALS
jgi:hypothetical protein